MGIIDFYKKFERRIKIKLALKFKILRSKQFLILICGFRRMKNIMALKSQIKKITLNF